MVTFVFTDIEGSTRLLEELGSERYGELLSQHHRVCRAAWLAHGGAEVDTAGDAFFVAFPTAAAALAAAADAQLALAELGLRVRMGVHTGEVSVTSTGYVGLEVHRAARIAAAAHGGQVVMSATAARDAGAKGLVDLGEHRFKDVPGADRDLPARGRRFPPLKTVSTTNLPRPASSFVGREQELAEVLVRVEMGARLVTLTGPGGSGKHDLRWRRRRRLSRNTRRASSGSGSQRCATPHSLPRRSRRRSAPRTTCPSTSLSVSCYSCSTTSSR